MQVWIAGGTGLIGRALSRALTEAGHAVCVLSRNPSGPGAYAWDAMAGSPLPDLPAPDAVISLAGEPVAQRWTPAVKARIRDSRVAGTSNLVHALSALPQPPQVFLSASAVGFYGDRGDELLDENSTAGKDFLANVCSEWEAAAHDAAAFARVCVVRIGIVLAPDGGALGKMLPPFRFGLGGPMGSGRQWMPWIAMDDLVRLFVFLLEANDSGTFNGTAPEPVRNRDFTQMLGRLLHRPAILPLPAAALRVMFGEMANAIIASQRVLPKRAPGFLYRYANVEDALRAVLYPGAERL